MSGAERQQQFEDAIRAQPGILPDIALDDQPMERPIHVFTTGRHHRGQRALRQPHVDADAVGRLVAVRLTEVEELASHPTPDVQEGDLRQALIDLLHITGQRAHQGVLDVL